MVKFTLFFLSLSFLIVLHEFGHFITARWFKARVDKFYLFFDFLFPFSNILKFSLFKKKVGNTEYGIGWFPFGGYVDIAGMMADPEKPLEDPRPDEFRAKKPYQRLIILAGGITMNFLLGIIIYSMMLWTWGEDYLPTENAKYGVAVDSTLIDAGFKDGDRILSVDGQHIERLVLIGKSIVIDGAKEVVVERNGERINISLPENFDDQFIAADAKYVIDAQTPFVIDSLEATAAAAKAGFLPGDSLITLNGDSIVFFQQFAKAFQRYKDKDVTIGFYRNGQRQELTTHINAEGQMGVFRKTPDQFLEYKHVDYGFFGSWGAGWNRTIETLTGYVKQLRFLFSKAGASKVGGFGSIASIFPAEWDWQAFWATTAMLSIILAFMNLLPIPVLDGGYILFVLYEMITRKKVSDKVMQKALAVGMYLVLALLVLANANDIYRFIIK